MSVTTFIVAFIVSFARSLGREVKYANGGKTNNGNNDNGDLAPILFPEMKGDKLAKPLRAFMLAGIRNVNGAALVQFFYSV